MMSMKKIMMLMGVVALMQFCLAGAQEATTPREGGNRGARQQRGGQQFNPQQMQERYMNRVKESLGVNDEEWKVLKPKVEKVRTAQMNTQRMGMGRRTGERAGTELSPIQKASQELQTVLAKKDSSAKDISAKLTALREAKKKSETELAEARKALKELLTQRQEAQLVMMGLLE